MLIKITNRIIHEYLVTRDSHSVDKNTAMSSCWTIVAQLSDCRIAPLHTLSQVSLARSPSFQTVIPLSQIIFNQQIPLSMRSIFKARDEPVFVSSSSVGIAETISNVIEIDNKTKNFATKFIFSEAINWKFTELVRLLTDTARLAARLSRFILASKSCFIL